jgi:6-phosphogluconolactonase
MSLLQAEVLSCRDRDALVQRAADLVRAGSAGAIAERGRAAVATSCGDVAGRVFESLGQAAFPWRDTHVFAANKCLRPRGDRVGAGYGTCDLLARLPAPKQHLHTVQLGITHPYGAASAYEQQLRAFFGIAGGELPRFDLIVLQLGEDARAASLFPFSSGLEETARLAVANYSREDGGQYVTFTAPLINQARNVVLLASGATVAPALRDTVVGEFDPRRLPAQLINPVNGTLHVLADHDAAAELHLAQRVTRAAGGERKTSLHLDERSGS